MFKKIFLIIVFSVSAFALYVYAHIPSEKDLTGCLTTTMFNIDLCANSKEYVKLKSISPYLQRAIILSEDSAFYSHNGFDEEGIQRCFEKLKEKKKIICGGSTISQQLAKNMFLSKDKSFLRKGIEALITVKIEKTLSKKEILEKYLNVIQFGKDIFGVRKASQFYFRKHPSELDVVESAFLAMVLPNPEKYSQSYFRKDLTKFARKRISHIMRDMHKYGSINDDEYFAGLSRLEHFLSKGQKSQNTKPAELTEEDLNEMSDELDSTSTSLDVVPTDTSDSE